MPDLQSLTLAELRDLLDECITRRLESTGGREHDHAGDELLRVVQELDRRGHPVAAASSRGWDPPRAVRRTAAPRAELRLPTAAGAATQPTPAHPVFASS